MKDFENCNLCEWRCGVDRLAGERGVCGLGEPIVAHSTLHPAPPASYDAFMAGCNFRCLFCQNWSMAHYPQNPESETEGTYEPREWAESSLAELASPAAELMGADRLFFTGGEPTPSLPWIEEVVREARTVNPDTRVNYDTNGFLTRESLKRVLDFATSITYDIKAFRGETFSWLTGAFVEPVLRNAETIGRHHKDKLWEFRIMMIEGVHDDELSDLCRFISDIDPTLPVNFLAFRPNFVMEDLHGPSFGFMRSCVKTAESCGLVNVDWSGMPAIRGAGSEFKGSDLARHYARLHGCRVEKRICKGCGDVDDCAIKKYVPGRRT
ncbi:MAG: radical SAM protein [Thermoplasmata archaeon]